MRYWKAVKDGLIIAIGTGDSGEQISEEEYLKISEAVENRPEIQDGFGCSLSEDLEWNVFELPEITGERL